MLLEKEKLKLPTTQSNQIHQILKILEHIDYDNYSYETRDKY